MKGNSAYCVCYWDEFADYFDGVTACKLLLRGGWSSWPWAWRGIWAGIHGWPVDKACEPPLDHGFKDHGGIIWRKYAKCPFLAHRIHRTFLRKRKKTGSFVLVFIRFIP